MNATAEEIVKSAVPLADLGVVDQALRGMGSLEDAVRRVRPADVGRDLSRRDLAQGRLLLAAADDRRAAAILRATHPSVAAGLLGSSPPATAARMLEHLSVDHRVSILAAMQGPVRAQIEAALPAADKADVRSGLSHAPLSVARHMTPKVWRTQVASTVAEAMKGLHDHAHDIEVAQNCYVVDGERLVGVIALRELAIADPTAPVARLMASDVIAVSVDTDLGAAAEIVQTHDFLSLPVIDGAGMLVGAIRVDDLLDAALAKVGAAFLNQGGVSGKVAASVPYFQTAIHRVVRSRVTWLVLLFVAETATGTVLRHFEDELAKVVALSFFVPLLIGTGGNAGSQTVSTIIRALALGEIRMSDTWRVLAKEVVTGVSLGLLLGAIAFGRALLWGVGTDLAGCVGVTVLVVCTWANTVGSLIPLAAQRLRIDPTVVSGPLITTLVDASGLFIYLTIAKVMISALH